MKKFSLKIDHDMLDSDSFDLIADKLLNRTAFEIAGCTHRLLEIEFYLNNEAHPDLYVHSNPDQLKLNKFYFHKFKNGTYKAGTFKGLDCTFGDTETNTYFGILLRAMINTETDQVIEGPCNLVNYILKQYDVESIADLTENKNLSIRSNSVDLIFTKTTDFELSDIWIAPRIGLSNKYPEYRSKPYRYVIFKHLIKKEKTKLIKLNH